MAQLAAVNRRQDEYPCALGRDRARQRPSAAHHPLAVPPVVLLKDSSTGEAWSSEQIQRESCVEALHLPLDCSM